LGGRRDDVSDANALTDLAWIRGYLAGRTGVVVPEDRPEFLSSRLSGVLRTFDLASHAALAERIRRGDRAVLAATIDALTTHETSFFRDVDVYTWLETEALPQVVASAVGRELAVWSAACSTGQEALSVGMLLLERWPLLSFRVHATDVSPGTIARARTGVYPVLEVNRGLPARRLARWFTRKGLDYQVVPELLGKVSFSVHNLIERGTLPGPFDMVLLRNVLIYFSEGDREAVFRNLAHAMRPGALLVLGTAETLIEPPAGLFTRMRGKQATWLVRAQGRPAEESS
jgi:chemotaxis protein methyltransferase CheR